MMTAKTRSRLPSTKLNMLFTEINSTLGHAKELILKAYNLAIQENYSPQQAKQLLLDNITEFKKTQIYAYLPSECKDPVKQKAGYLSHKTEVSVPEPEQNTETAIELDCNEQVLKGFSISIYKEAGNRIEGEKVAKDLLQELTLDRRCNSSDSSACISR